MKRFIVALLASVFFAAPVFAEDAESPPAPCTPPGYADLFEVGQPVSFAGMFRRQSDGASVAVQYVNYKDKTIAVGLVVDTGEIDLLDPDPEDVDVQYFVRDLDKPCSFNKKRSPESTLKDS